MRVCDVGRVLDIEMARPFLSGCRSGDGEGEEGPRKKPTNPLTQIPGESKGDYYRRLAVMDLETFTLHQQEADEVGVEYVGRLLRMIRPDGTGEPKVLDAAEDMRLETAVGNETRPLFIHDWIRVMRSNLMVPLDRVPWDMLKVKHLEVLDDKPNVRVGTDLFVRPYWVRWLEHLTVRPVKNAGTYSTANAVRTAIMVLAQRPPRGVRMAELKKLELIGGPESPDSVSLKALVNPALGLSDSLEELYVHGTPLVRAFAEIRMQLGRLRVLEIGGDFPVGELKLPPPRYQKHNGPGLASEPRAHRIPLARDNATTRLARLHVRPVRSDGHSSSRRRARHQDGRKRRV